MSNWHEEQHLATDFSKTFDVVVQQMPSEARRIYPAPLYDQNGDLRCRSCGQPITRSITTKGHGVASCSDSGCAAHGFETLEGSYDANPSRTR